MNPSMSSSRHWRPRRSAIATRLADSSGYTDLFARLKNDMNLRPISRQLSSTNMPFALSWGAKAYSTINKVSMISWAQRGGDLFVRNLPTGRPNIYWVYSGEYRQAV